MEKESLEKVINKEDGMIEKLNAGVMKLGEAMERARIDEYTSMLTRPWRFFFINFLAGIFRGVGLVIGMTIVAAIVFYILAKVLVSMVDLPLIGNYIAEISAFVNQYIEQGLPRQ